MSALFFYQKEWLWLKHWITNENSDLKDKEFSEPYEKLLKKIVLSMIVIYTSGMILFLISPIEYDDYDVSMPLFIQIPGTKFVLDEL